MQLCASLQQLLAEVGVSPAVAEIPLASGDYLQGAVAFFKELHGVRNRLGFADQLARCGSHLGHLLAGLVDSQTCDLLIGSQSPLGRDSVRRLRKNAAVVADDGAHIQLQLSPPGDIRRVAEGADHGDA